MLIFNGVVHPVDALRSLMDMWSWRTTRSKESAPMEALPKWLRSLLPDVKRRAHRSRLCGCPLSPGAVRRRPEV